jgi:hypothetical protein
MTHDSVWRGVVIEESVRDLSFLGEARRVGESRSELEEESERGSFTFVRVVVPDRDVERFADAARQAIVDGGGWYIHLVGPGLLLLIYPSRVFRLAQGDDRAVKEAIEYGQRVEGIHRAQLDLPYLFDHPFG